MCTFGLSPMAVMAADKTSDEMAAETLNSIGLFLGVGTDPNNPDFALSSAATRIQGLVMLVRLMGAESDALGGGYPMPFIDVPDWGAPYVAYAYAMGWTRGVSETQFNPNQNISATQYLTFVLRALGYSDTAGDFSWDSAWSLTNRIGITSGEFSASNNTLDRGDMAIVSLFALNTPMKGSDQTLVAHLAADGVFEKLAEEGLIKDADVLLAIESGSPGALAGVLAETVAEATAEVKTAQAEEKAAAEKAAADAAAAAAAAAEKAAAEANGNGGGGGSGGGGGGLKPKPQPSVVSVESVHIETTTEVHVTMAELAGTSFTITGPNSSGPNGYRWTGADSGAGVTHDGTKYVLTVTALLENAQYTLTVAQSGKTSYTNTANMKFLADVTITGTVSGGGVVSQYATVSLKVGDITHFSDTTDSGGEYTLAGVPAGAYTFEVILPGYKTFTSNLTAAQMYGTSLTIDVDLEALPSGSSAISGEVTLTGNTIARTVDVQAKIGIDVYAAGTASVGANANATSYTGIIDLPAGTFTLEFSAPGYVTDTLEVTVDGVASATNQDITLEIAELPNGTFTIGPTGTGVQGAANSAMAIETGTSGDEFIKISGKVYLLKDNIIAKSVLATLETGDKFTVDANAITAVEKVTDTEYVMEDGAANLSTVTVTLPGAAVNSAVTLPAAVDEVVNMPRFAVRAPYTAGDLALTARGLTRVVLTADTLNAKLPTASFGGHVKSITDATGAYGVLASTWTVAGSGTDEVTIAHADFIVPNAQPAQLSGVAEPFMTGSPFDVLGEDGKIKITPSDTTPISNQVLTVTGTEIVDITTLFRIPVGGTFTATSATAATYEAPKIPAPALAGVTVSAAAGNYKQTRIAMPALPAGATKFLYQIETDAVPRPHVGADWSAHNGNTLTASTNNLVTVDDGKNIGIVAANASDEVVQFVNVVAAVTPVTIADAAVGDYVKLVNTDTEAVTYVEVEVVGRIPVPSDGTYVFELVKAVEIVEVGSDGEALGGEWTDSNEYDYVLLIDLADGTVAGYYEIDGSGETDASVGTYRFEVIDADEFVEVDTKVPAAGGTQWTGSNADDYVLLIDLITGTVDGYYIIASSGEIEAANGTYRFDRIDADEFVTVTGGAPDAGWTDSDEGDYVLLIDLDDGSVDGYYEIDGDGELSGVSNGPYRFEIVPAAKILVII